MSLPSTANLDQPIRAKLIFNPISGAPGDSPAQLLQILTEMQDWNLLPEVTLFEPGMDLVNVVHDALRRGIRHFLVSGGDGTIDTVAGALSGAHAVLAIVPTGTQNNVALSLGLPADIPGAVALLRNGRPLRVDLGIAACGESVRLFLEVCSVGLLSALFPAADDIQHGNIARIGDLLATLVAFSVADLHLVLDSHKQIHTQGHVVLIGNMPYIGPHYQIAAQGAHQDGLLDVLVFNTASKLDLLGSVVTSANVSVEDPRLQRYQVHSLTIYTDPPMPVMVDGFSLGESPLTIKMRRRAVTIMTGPLSPGEIVG